MDRSTPVIFNAHGHIADTQNLYTSCSSFPQVHRTFTRRPVPLPPVQNKNTGANERRCLYIMAWEGMGEGVCEGAVPFSTDVPMLEKRVTRCFAKARSHGKTTFEQNSFKPVMQENVIFVSLDCNLLGPVARRIVLGCELSPGEGSSMGSC